MGVLNKFVFGILSISLLSSVSFALENEFKNTLTKIDLIKTGENSYNVNLQTDKKISETIKVIKKSDLNYYILLPETNNSVTTTAVNGQDIRGVSADLYPYAGQDVNNGYTKININTSKPINFTVNAKGLQNVLNEKKESVALAQKDSLEDSNDSKVQKKNLVFQESAKVLKKENIISATKNLKEKIKPTKKRLAQVEVQRAVKIEDLIREEVQKAKEERYLAYVQQEEELTKAIEEIENSSSNNQLTTDDLAELEKIATSKENKYTLIDSIKTKLVSLKNVLSEKLREYGISLKDFAVMVLALFSGLMIIIFLLNRRNPQTRLKNKSDLIDKSQTLVPKKEIQQEQKPKNDGQYFVFDKNIKTGFCDPSTSAIKKNYELSSYEPELNQDYNRYENQVVTKKAFGEKNKDEYEIIQKILKEDSFIEIAPGEYEAVSKIQTIQSKAPVEVKKQEDTKDKVQTAPIKKEEQVVEQNEPEVLSSVEIAPQRGFMCVSYNDNISFLGYIFDDVFPLHNFKQPKLENYEIKYRLSEKDDKGTNFIIKLDNTKMLVRVTKTAMNLEVIL